jgi:hypothetical protein
MQHTKARIQLGRRETALLDSNAAQEADQQ